MMQKITLLLLACALFACSDNDKLPSGGGDRDASSEKRDAGSTDERDGGETPAASGLERAPGSLPRPPGKKLPDDLKPPGYEK